MTASDPIEDSPENDRVSGRLERERPIPDPGFRGALGRHLCRADPGWGHRPERLWGPVLATVALGVVLMIVGALVGAGGV